MEMQTNESSTDNRPSTPTDTQALRKKIKAAAREAQESRERREAENDTMKEIVSSIVAAGVNRHAFKHELKRLNMDPTQRAEYDFSRSLVADALGIPDQGDLFPVNDAGETTH